MSLTAATPPTPDDYVIPQQVNYLTPHWSPDGAPRDSRRTEWGVSSPRTPAHTRAHLARGSLTLTKVWRSLGLQRIRLARARRRRRAAAAAAEAVRAPGSGGGGSSSESSAADPRRLELRERSSSASGGTPGMSPTTTPPPRRCRSPVPWHVHLRRSACQQKRREHDGTLTAWSLEAARRRKRRQRAVYR